MWRPSGGRGGQSRWESGLARRCGRSVCGAIGSCPPPQLRYAVLPSNTAVGVKDEKRGADRLDGFGVRNLHTRAERFDLFVQVVELRLDRLGCFFAFGLL